MTGLWDNTSGLLLVPIAVWLIAAGYGLLIERVARVRLPDALLIPVGFCGAVVVSLGAYEANVGDALTLPAVLLLALAGGVLARRELPGRLNAGWPLVIGLCAYVLFALSVIASGHWTFTGYNIDNDSAFELVLISHLQAHGTAAASTVPSTANSVVKAYLGTGYPLGAQSLLGVVSGLLGVPAVVALQSFISAVAGIGAMAASQLSGRTLGPRLAALAGLLAVASALFYQYALQGGIKEVGVAVAILASLATIRWAIVSPQATGAIAVVAVPLAAVLATFNAAGIPYVGALIASGLVAALLLHRRWRLRAWLRGALVGGATFGLLAIPALVTLGTFFNTVTVAYSAVSPGGSQAPSPATLGPLLRPLPLSEISGVWLQGDYRLPVPPGTAAVITVAVTVIVLVLLVPGILRMIEAREPGPLMGLATMALVLIVVYPRVVPYAQAKLLMIASPVVVLAALQALTGAGQRRWQVLMAITGIGIGAAVLASDIFAYHDFPVAPTNRLVALKQIGQRVRAGGPVLVSEFEQYAKYFLQPANAIVGADDPTPKPLALLHPMREYDHSYDLNDERLAFVETFPYVLTRSSPLSSPPPANFTLLDENAYYQLWKRQASPRVLAHVPVASQTIGSAPPSQCASLRSLVSIAPANAELAVATLPPVYGFTLSSRSVRSSGWVAGGPVPGLYVTTTRASPSRRSRWPEAANTRRGFRATSRGRSR